MKRLTTIGLVTIGFIVSVAFIYSCGGDGGSDIPDDYYFWEQLGSPGVGGGTPRAIAIDPSDSKPVIVFIDKINDHKPHVKKWSDNTSWTDMGFLTTVLGDHPSLTIDPSDNKPIVVFVDNMNNGRAHVKKWDTGTSWIDLGFPSTGDTRGWTRPPSITIDPSDNKPVVAFGDDDNSGRIHVTKWSSGTSWTDLGLVSAGSGYSPSIAIDPSDDKPIVAFVDNVIDGRAHVKKWDTVTSWTDLGLISAGLTLGTVVAIDPSDNKPIVAFVEYTVDYYSPSQVHVKKWSSGILWTDLGYPSQVNSDSVSIAIDPSDNKPVVVFRDWANDSNLLGHENGIHVKKWSGGTSWFGLGYPSEGPSFGPSIAIDPSDNKPVVMFGDSVHGDGNVYVSKHP